MRRSRNWIWRRASLGFAFLMIGGLMVGAGVGQLSSGALAQDDTSNLREVGIIAEADDTLKSMLADCTEVAALQPGELTGVEDGLAGYVINGEPSEARYVIEEVLAGVGANTAVGSTNAIIGQILVDEHGVPAACSRFDVGMRTLESDSSRRDNFIRGDTLQSDQYPVATFVLRAVEGLDASLNSEVQTFTLIGDLIFRGKTQLVAWETTGTLDGGELTGTAFTEFEMVDYNIQKPIVGSVVSIDDMVRLEVDIVAQQA